MFLLSRGVVRALRDRAVRTAGRLGHFTTATTPAGASGIQRAPFHAIRIGTWPHRILAGNADHKPLPLRFFLRQVVQDCSSTVDESEDRDEYGDDDDEYDEAQLIVDNLTSFLNEGGRCQAFLHYALIDKLKDQGQVKVLRSLYDVVSCGMQMGNCLSALPILEEPPPGYFAELFVKLEGTNGELLAVASYRDGDWDHIAYNVNRSRGGSRACGRGRAGPRTSEMEELLNAYLPVLRAAEKSLRKRPGWVQALFR